VTETFSNARALMIGVGADLPVTAADAKKIANIFADPARCAVPQEKVRVLVDRDATCDGIVTALKELARVAEPSDVVTVYFSGHGTKMPTAPESRSLVAQDGLLSGGDFTELLKAIQVQRMLVLLDCCYAGGMHEGLGIKGIPAKAVPTPFDAHALLLRRGSGTVVLSSSGPNEVSEPGNPYSRFTLALIEALCGKGMPRHDGYVRVADLAMYVAYRVFELTDGRQHPTLDLEGADNYPVAYYSAGSKAVNSLPDWFPGDDADNNPNIVKEKLYQKFFLELAGSLKKISPEDFRDLRISDQRLEAADRALLAVEPMRKILHAASDAEVSYPTRANLQDADGALTTCLKEVKETVDILRDVDSKKSARLLCKALEQQSADLLTAYAQAISLIT
jgi:Caspase domain